MVRKRLVEMMEGEIGVNSSVGVGSIFWFELKLASAANNATAAQQVRTRPSAPAPFEAPGRTLLYVNDNQANVELVEQIIARRPNLRLLRAGNGTSGITLARMHQPAVILMDINLPGITGYQALQILQEDLATARIPVLALSANAMPSDIDKGLAAGFLRYLTKPLKVDEFMAVLDLALQAGQPPRPPSAANPAQGDDHASSRCPPTTGTDALVRHRTTRVAVSAKCVSAANRYRVSCGSVYGLRLRRTPNRALDTLISSWAQHLARANPGIKLRGAHGPQRQRRSAQRCAMRMSVFGNLRCAVVADMRRQGRHQHQ